ncbi:hypothetical protein E4U35_008064 [Claviceps purpurea]|nr:hypothetical protein E4U35_008064 [Claviceps purpurea]
MAAPHLLMLLLLLDLSPVAVASAEQPRLPIIKRQPPNSHDKILAEHLEFALSPSPPSPLEYADAARFFLPAFAPHQDDVVDGGDHRARSLSQRAYCPAGMNSCDSSGSPTKCCPEGTHCQLVPDSDVGHIACCPSGSTCGGGVGQCPAGAVSCAASLGGGCCIAGYVCQGDGCVLSASATHAIETSKSGPRVTISSTKTTVSGGSSLRPTSQVTITTDAAPESSSPLTQTGCPTGFYGCLAVHQGGCCRTERDCHTYSCPPPPPATTLVSGGVTVVVPAPGPAESTSTADGKSCAGGWFLCGKDDGVAPGCCPSGYECGSASCFPSGATATATNSGVPKKAPDKSVASKVVGVWSLWSAVVMTLLSLAVFSL